MLEENVVSAAGNHHRHNATVRELVRIAHDAGFRPAIRNSRFQILEYPDVEYVPGNRRANAELEEGRAVGAD